MEPNIHAGADTQVLAGVGVIRWSGQGGHPEGHPSHLLTSSPLELTVRKLRGTVHMDLTFKCIKQNHPRSRLSFLPHGHRLMSLCSVLSGLRCTLGCVCEKTLSCTLIAYGIPACPSNISNYIPIHIVNLDNQIFLVLPDFTSTNSGILFSRGAKYCCTSLTGGDFGYRRSNQMLKHSTSHQIQHTKQAFAGWWAVSSSLEPVWALFTTEVLFKEYLFVDFFPP